MRARNRHWGGDSLVATDESNIALAARLSTDMQRWRDSNHSATLRKMARQFSDATTHERAFHKCLDELLKLRNHKINQQFGFASEKRASERHQNLLELEKINHRLQ